MATYKAVEVWVQVDDAGDYEVGPDPAAALERYEAAVQPVGDAAGVRLVKLTVRVPLPTVIELTGEVAADEAPAALTAT